MLTLCGTLLPVVVAPVSQRGSGWRLPRLGGGACALVSGLALSGAIGCHELTGSQPLPAGTASPATYNTPAGALGMRNQALVDLERALVGYLVETGSLTDELESNQVGASPGVLSSSSLPYGGSLDERILPELNSGGTGTSSYGSLQQVRADVNQALGALLAYDTVRADTATAKVHRAELYALEGYTEILLADFYCSGVPLSTLDFQQDFTYHASATTTEVYQDAVAKLDSAILLADTSTQVLNLARVLRGRAFLDQGLALADSAAQAVAAVPDQFQYQLAVQWSTPGGSVNSLNNFATVADHEGENGLPFITGNDPRTQVTSLGITSNVHEYAVLYFPQKYAAGLTGGGFAPFPVADWIEARLIRAEVALYQKDYSTWLTQLNTLRETARVPGDTTAMADTTDPGSSGGTDSARVSLTFHERAMWLFLTGHRVGDLRRLARQYHRNPATIYPIGAYLAPGAGQYGTDVNAPIPAAEYANPLFHGCLDRAP